MDVERGLAGCSPVLTLTNADAAYDIVQVGAAPAPLGWQYHQVLAPQRHLEQVSLSLVVGGIPPLPHWARLVPSDGCVPGTGPGSGSAARSARRLAMRSS